MNESTDLATESASEAEADAGRRRELLVIERPASQLHSHMARNSHARIFAAATDGFHFNDQNLGYS
jgi:hypothetical protein